jgi:hypothetical protein
MGSYGTWQHPASWSLQESQAKLGIGLYRLGRAYAGRAYGVEAGKFFPPMNCAHFHVWAWIKRKPGETQGILCIGADRP